MNQTNGRNLDERLTGWPNDARLARIIIHVEVAEAVFQHHPLAHRREFHTPQAMFEYAERLRERQKKGKSTTEVMEDGLRLIKDTTLTEKQGG